MSKAIVLLKAGVHERYWKVTVRRVDQAENISWKRSSLALEPKVLPKEKRRCLSRDCWIWDKQQYKAFFSSKFNSFFLRSNGASIYVHCVTVYDKNNYFFLLFSNHTLLSDQHTRCQSNTNYCQAGTHFCQAITHKIRLAHRKSDLHTKFKKNLCASLIFLCATQTKVCVSSIIPN